MKRAIEPIKATITIIGTITLDPIVNPSGEGSGVGIGEYVFCSMIIV